MQDAVRQIRVRGNSVGEIRKRSAGVDISLLGTTNSAVSDVALVRCDPKSRTFVPGTPKAVKVTLHRDSMVARCTS